MKRGTEKPIEIFVALFVILAVALVMLKLFQGQITEQKAALSNYQQEQLAQEMQQNLVLHCQSKCTEASNNGCSRQSLAALCLAGSHQVFDTGESLDFNGNNNIDFNTEQYGGVGVCEDQVHCFNAIDNCCAQKITPESCSQILNSFWDSKGWTEGSDGRDAVCSSVSAGSCADTVDSSLEPLAWWNEFDACELGN